LLKSALSRSSMCTDGTDTLVCALAGCSAVEPEKTFCRGLDFFKMGTHPYGHAKATLEPWGSIPEPEAAVVHGRSRQGVRAAGPSLSHGRAGCSWS
jgi:hypothetical protein